MSCVSCDICVYHLWYVCVFFPRVFLSSRVTGACPVTTDLIMRVNVRTTTTMAALIKKMKKYTSSAVVCDRPLKGFYYIKTQLCKLRVRCFDRYWVCIPSWRIQVGDSPSDNPRANRTNRRSTLFCARKLYQERYRRQTRTIIHTNIPDGVHRNCAKMRTHTLPRNNMRDRSTTHSLQRYEFRLKLSDPTAGECCIFILIII